MSLSATAPRLFITSRDGDSTASLGSPCQCLTTLSVGALGSWCCNSGGKLQKVPVTVASLGKEIPARLGTDCPAAAGAAGSGGLFSSTFPARFFPRYFRVKTRAQSIVSSGLRSEPWRAVLCWWSPLQLC